MAKIDTDSIWESLGSFMEFFPEEERVYLATLWESYSDVVADLWGYAYQTNLAKGVFTTRPTFERRNTLLITSNFTEIAPLEFELSSITTDPSGLTVARGFVPRELRKIKATQIPPAGFIRIGVDKLPYVFVNPITIEGGEFDGFVREATFTLASQPPHDYADSRDFNDPFHLDAGALVLRVDHSFGEAYVDAVLEDANSPITVNPTGKVIVGQQGVNAEFFEYQSVGIIADRYVFYFPTTFRDPAVDPPALAYNHLLGESVSVLRYDAERWTQSITGAGRVYSDNRAIMVIDDEDDLGPLLSPARVELRSNYPLEENNDFDVSIFAEIDIWETPVTAFSERRAGAELEIGNNTFFIGIKAETGGDSLVYGNVLTLTSVPLALLPAGFEARFKKVGGSLELQYREQGEADYQLLETIPVTGQRATMILASEDSGTSSASEVAFDEALRRRGQVVGSTRLESAFRVTETFPYRYDIDQRITSANLLRDRPRLHDEFGTVAREISDPEELSVIVIGGDDFELGGVQDAGILEIDGKILTYDEVVNTSGLLEFKLRQKPDPDLIPISVGTEVRMGVREVDSSDFHLTGDGRIWFEDQPTRDRLWAPVCEVDQLHIQNSFGELVDLTADISTPNYLRRVQGVWFALFNGPSFLNVHTGLQLTMGLPVAQVSGTVERTETKRDALGNVLSRNLVITNADGEFNHYLDPGVDIIDFIYGPGDVVERFDPLTDGIEIMDYITDPLWHERFPGQMSDAERFNAFGVFVAIEAITEQSSFSDAITFALRIKGHWTKIFLNFILLGGREDIIIEEDLFATQVANLCEDISFNEGPPPPNWQDPLRMGDGHKMGQGKVLGGPDVFQSYPQMGWGLYMGTGLTMGMTPRAFACDPIDQNQASEVITATQVITFASPP